MKIFLSWSGPQSRAVAQALNDWLPRVIQAVRVFFSPDIEKGATWSNELDGALEGTSFGIVCLTPQNLTSPWIHYEAGALSKLREARVWTFLLDLKPGEVGQPLGRFQHTVAEKEDVRKLLRTINSHLAAAGGVPLGEHILGEIFDDSWPRLEARLQEARGIAVQEEIGVTLAPDVRGERAMLEEMLELLRDQQRRLTALETPTAAPTASARDFSEIERVTGLAKAVNAIASNLTAEHPTWRVVKRNRETQVSAAVLGVRGQHSAVLAFVTRSQASFPRATVEWQSYSEHAATVVVQFSQDYDGQEAEKFFLMAGLREGVSVERIQFFAEIRDGSTSPGGTAASL